MKSLGVVSAAIVLVCGHVVAEEAFSEYSEYFGEVVRVVDGDTIDVRVSLWPGIVAEQSIRIRGIDAPEVHRPKCENERRLGEDASIQAERLYDVGSVVRIQNVTEGSFSGRVVADVSRWRSDRWLYFKDEMLARELVAEWTPSDPAIEWCPQ